MWKQFDAEPLFGIQRQSCEENGVQVTLCDVLLDHGMLDADHVRIFKPDAFFSARIVSNPPKSVDCLVIVKKDCPGEVMIWLIENRDIKNREGFQSREIEEKFKTTLEWLDEHFKDFLTTVRLVSIKAWFVTTLYQHMNEDVQRRRFRGLSLDVFQSRTLRFGNLPVQIEPLLSPQQICYW
ncbi:MAG: hypothetical protein G8237_12800 [Magnetococcales bacterium]|nr:hypothetical protein [Magnetococcales bacterium]